MRDFKKKVQKVTEFEDEEVNKQFNFLNSVFLASFQTYQSSADPKHNGSVFSNRLIMPFLEMIASHLSDYNDFQVTCFPAEEPLLSMTNCLKETNRTYIYLADSIFRLCSLHNIEFLLLKVSGAFLNNDQTKIDFYHHKSMFGSLSILQTIAEQFKFGTIEDFKNIDIC